MSGLFNPACVVLSIFSQHWVANWVIFNFSREETVEQQKLYESCLFDTGHQWTANQSTHFCNWLLFLQHLVFMMLTLE